jgi:hypothetical protein
MYALGLARVPALLDVMATGQGFDSVRWVTVCLADRQCARDGTCIVMMLGEDYAFSDELRLGRGTHLR